MKFNTIDAGKIGNHTFSIEDIHGTLYIGVDDEKQPVTFKAKQQTNYWAIENAIKILLNRVHEKSPA